MPAIPFIVMAGMAAASAAKGRSEGRKAEAEYLQKRDAAELERAEVERKGQLDKAALELNQQTTSNNLRSQDTDQAVRGGALQGIKDVEFNNLPDYIRSRMPTVTGGARPSAIVNKEAIGKTLQEQAMSNLLSGRKFENPTLAPVPGMSTPPQPTGLDKFLNIVGTVGSVAGGYQAARGGGGASYGAGQSYVPKAEQIVSGYRPIQPGSGMA